ncbi:UNKNOWN [Stylonychia lemnae]|uniref:Uncharacterized protein n=1 Tax=Stylonychia lemnae TaxID=5949 RepID=A0A077ZVQ7_STYLE|nr:UNKNOWN [Stylonychia lemnae]|eukprot:CDW72521.1 UNKNOWN [Stylonychia lemnae]
MDHTLTIQFTQTLTNRPLSPTPLSQCRVFQQVQEISDYQPQYNTTQYNKYDHYANGEICLESKMQQESYLNEDCKSDDSEDARQNMIQNLNQGAALDQSFSFSQYISDDLTTCSLTDIENISHQLQLLNEDNQFQREAITSCEEQQLNILWSSQPSLNQCFSPNSESSYHQYVKDLPAEDNESSFSNFNSLAQQIIKPSISDCPKTQDGQISSPTQFKDYIIDTFQNESTENIQSEDCNQDRFKISRINFFQITLERKKQLILGQFMQPFNLMVSAKEINEFSIILDQLKRLDENSPQLRQYIGYLVSMTRQVLRFKETNSHSKSRLILEQTLNPHKNQLKFNQIYTKFINLITQEEEYNVFKIQRVCQQFLNIESITQTNNQQYLLQDLENLINDLRFRLQLQITEQLSEVDKLLEEMPVQAYNLFKHFLNRICQ